MAADSPFGDPLNQLSSVGLSNVNNTLTIANQNFSQLLQILNAAFPRITGTFTATAGASTTVNNASITASSLVFLLPTNAAARTLQAGASMMSVPPSSNVAGVSFTAVTASGSAAGTETFAYFAVTPV